MNIPELLAPAGGMEQLRAAVQNGADAVYMGGTLFNARAKAENFTKHDMEAAVAYAHDRGVKVYVTMNTLIKDSELFDAFSYVDFLRVAGADALIVQDIGLARLVGSYMPDMPLHMSTQGTLYNKQAVEMAKEMGFARIVPARELSLSEIREFAKECHCGERTCQTEVFVHGALCMCYSGQCQMSRVIGGGTDGSGGGRSGNRGTCAQPCRLAYRDAAGDRRFLLSPKDLCGLTRIPELCGAGVDSLKIEGRLKSAQYVAVVTAVYRKYLDMYRDTGSVDIDAEDMEKLLRIFNRGGFTTGYLDENPEGGLLSGDSPKNTGVYIGKVAGVKKGSTLVDINVEKNGISMGDGVEIRGNGLTGNVISYIKPLKGGAVRIGDIRGRVGAGDKVYKVTDKALTAAAERSYGDDLARKFPVRMEFTAKVGEEPILVMERTPDGERVSVGGGTICEAAVNRPLDEERIAKQLGKLGDTLFEADSIDVVTEGGPALPVSVVNGMRREAAERLLEAMRARRAAREPLSDEEREGVRKSEGLGDPGALYDNAMKHRGIFIFGEENVRLAAEEGLRGLGVSVGSGPACLPESEEKKPGSPADGELTVYIPITLFMDERLRARLVGRLAADGAGLVPYIINVSKGSEDRYIEENFDHIAAAVGGSGIMLNNMGWIRQFRSAGIRVFGGYGLNVYNSLSLKAYEEMGVEVRAYSHEDGRFYRGGVPLMITEHPVTSETFTDRKGAVYDVMKWYSGDKYLIFRREDRRGNGKTRGGKKDGAAAFIEYMI